MFRHLSAPVIVALFCSVGWAQSSTKLTRANYERIKVGLTVRAVTDLFGKAHARLKELNREPRGRGKKSIGARH